MQVEIQIELLIFAAVILIAALATGRFFLASAAAGVAAFLLFAYDIASYPSKESPFIKGAPFRLLGMSAILLAVGVFWKWRKGASEWLLKKLDGIWEKCKALLPKASDEDTPSDKADKFWEENAYVVIRNFGILGLATLVVAVLLSLALDEREVLRATYYFFLFIGGGLAAAIATWRGRQFEKQLRAARFEKAIEMAMETENEIRNEFGADTLLDMLDSTSSLSQREKKRIRSIAIGSLKIREDRAWYLEIHSALRKEGMNDALNKKILAEAERFSREARQSFFLMLLELSPRREGDSLEGKKQIIWDAASRLSGTRMIFPYIRMEKIAYLGDSDESVPDQIACIYYRNQITNSIMRKVDFRGSMFFGISVNDTDLSDSKFDDTRMHQSVFGSGTTLKNSSFRDASLWSCTFFGGSDISICNFTNANLTGCNFFSTDISGCNFAGANISGCDFEIAKGVEPVLFKSAFYKEGSEPEFPEGWKEEKFWRGTGWSNLREFLSHLRGNAEAREGTERVPHLESSGGEKGPEPSDGEKGPEAPDGEKGPEAPDGEKGPEAPDGEKGPEAPDGEKGPEAPDGEQGGGGEAPPSEGGQGGGGEAPPSDGGQEDGSGGAPGAAR